MANAEKRKVAELPTRMTHERLEALLDKDMEDARAGKLNWQEITARAKLWGKRLHLLDRPMRRAEALSKVPHLSHHLKLEDFNL